MLPVVALNGCLNSVTVKRLAPVHVKLIFRKQLSLAPIDGARGALNAQRSTFNVQRTRRLFLSNSQYRHRSHVTSAPFRFRHFNLSFVSFKRAPVVVTPPTSLVLPTPHYTIRWVRLYSAFSRCYRTLLPMHRPPKTIGVRRFYPCGQFFHSAIANPGYYLRIYRVRQSLWPTLKMTKRQSFLILSDLVVSSLSSRVKEEDTKTLSGTPASSHFNSSPRIDMFRQFGNANSSLRKLTNFLGFLLCEAWLTLLLSSQ